MCVCASAHPCIVPCVRVLAAVRATVPVVALALTATSSANPPRSTQVLRAAPPADRGRGAGAERADAARPPGGPAEHAQPLGSRVPRRGARHLPPALPARARALPRRPARECTVHRRHQLPVPARLLSRHHVAQALPPSGAPRGRPHQPHPAPVGQGSPERGQHGHAGFQGQGGLDGAAAAHRAPGRGAAEGLHHQARGHRGEGRAGPAADAEFAGATCEGGATLHPQDQGQGPPHVLLLQEALLLPHYRGPQLPEDAQLQGASCCALQGGARFQREIKGHGERRKGSGGGSGGHLGSGRNGGGSMKALPAFESFLLFEGEKKQLLKDPQVLFAGYKVPHPLEHKIIIRVQTTLDYSPRKPLPTPSPTSSVSCPCWRSASGRACFPFAFCRDCQFPEASPATLPVQPAELLAWKSPRATGKDINKHQEVSKSTRSHRHHVDVHLPVFPGKILLNCAALAKRGGTTLPWQRLGMKEEERAGPLDKEPSTDYRRGSLWGCRHCRRTDRQMDNSGRLGPAIGLSAGQSQLLVSLLLLLTRVQPGTHVAAREHISYVPQLSNDTLAGRLTLSTFTLEQPLGQFSSHNISDLDTIWLVVALSNATQSFMAPRTNQDIPAPANFSQRGYYLTLRANRALYQARGQLHVLRIGNDTHCQPTKIGCNHPLPGPGPYRVKFLVMNDEGPVAETKWSSDTRLQQGSQSIFTLAILKDLPNKPMRGADTSEQILQSRENWGRTKVSGVPKANDDQMSTKTSAAAFCLQASPSLPDDTC
ncbi:uncharacterized protein LOC107973173 isoform X2 [Pan troglodytes]|uniref:uncharacterized protein LOC107973173 isoform X2 n=1 Tax=Pan troglodytes TaxID=9598 RepID=UPI003013EB95